MPDATLAYINDIVLPVSWTTIDELHHNLYYAISHKFDGRSEKPYWI